MRIDLVELRLLRLPLARHFETSFGRSTDRTFVLVTVHADGIAGWGECVAEAHPYYSSETADGAYRVLAQYLVPLLLGVDLADPREVGPRLRRVRGHRMAKGALEMAIWDLYARSRNEPLSQVLGGTHRRIASGVSIGIQDTVEELLERIAMERAAGYQRVKIKIKPGWDVEVVERVRARYADLPLMVDANAAYTPADTDRLRALDAFDLLMIEQPLAEDDLVDHAALQRQLKTPICLDESIESREALEAALALGACRIVNVKPGRLGGFAESLAVHDRCGAAGIPVWHGGMLESGIGRAHNIHLASLPNFTLPGDIGASSRYYQPDLIDPPIEVASDGTIAVPDGPGIGVAIVPERVQQATLRQVALRAGRQ
ncbi:MAG TPA: o-succinylbenzoate synthase [Vicinamibacterales bacterium]